LLQRRNAPGGEGSFISKDESCAKTFSRGFYIPPPPHPPGPLGIVGGWGGGPPPLQGSLRIRGVMSGGAFYMQVRYRRGGGNTLTS
jgi:hypothetical protein